MSEPPWPATDDFARYIQQPQQPADRLQAGVDMIVRLVDGCDHAGVTITVGPSITTAAASDDLVRQGDSWQYELDQGPCLQTVRTAHTVLSQDLRTEHRWPLWSPRILAAGVNAMMCLALCAQHNTLGSLNLYADHRHAWSDDALTIAHALAGRLAAALADAREAEHRRAMMTRTVIGRQTHLTRQL